MNNQQSHPLKNAPAEQHDASRAGRKYMVSADRSSASRKVRYREGSLPDAENCKVCQVG